MTLDIIPIVSLMPDDPLESLEEFETVLLLHCNNNTFDPGSMLVFTGKRLKLWYSSVNRTASWLIDVEDDQVYALGVDAFESEVD